MFHCLRDDLSDFGSALSRQDLTVVAFHRVDAHFLRTNLQSYIGITFQY